MLAQTTGNDVLVAACAALPPTLLAFATLITVLRGRGRAQAAHEALAKATVNTYNGVAEVAKAVGAGDAVPTLEPATPAEPEPAP